jgi:DNA-binding MarR family transcriptional regulator
MRKNPGVALRAAQRAFFASFASFARASRTAAPRLGEEIAGRQLRADPTCRRRVGHVSSEASGHRRPDEPFFQDLLARASHALIDGFAQELHRRGTSLPVWRVMAALCADPGQTVSALAEASLLQQPTMTKLLDRMARDGLVERTQDARDRRVVRVALTPEGQAKAAELMSAAARYEAEVLARHPEAEGTKAALREIIARSGPARRARGGEGA